MSCTCFGRRAACPCAANRAHCGLACSWVTCAKNGKFTCGMKAVTEEGKHHWHDRLIPSRLATRQTARHTCISWPTDGSAAGAQLCASDVLIEGHAAWRPSSKGLPRASSTSETGPMPGSSSRLRAMQHICDPASCTAQASTVPLNLALAWFRPCPRSALTL